jgi:hypothetical protein
MVRTHQSSPKRESLENDLADCTILKGNEGVEKRHEHEHGGFKKSKRYPAIDFPDGGDSDGGPDNVPPPDKISKRIPAIDFPDGGDSDGGPDNVPPPDKVIERNPAIDFPDGGDSDGGPDNVPPPPPKKAIERDVRLF